jgi:hypothetical protein
VLHSDTGTGWGGQLTRAAGAIAKLAVKELISKCFDVVPMVCFQCGRRYHTENKLVAHTVFQSSNGTVNQPIIHPVFSVNFNLIAEFCFCVEHCLLIRLDSSYRVWRYLSCNILWQELQEEYSLSSQMAPDL